MILAWSADKNIIDKYFCKNHDFRVNRKILYLELNFILIYNNNETHNKNNYDKLIIIIKSLSSYVEYTEHFL